MSYQLSAISYYMIQLYHICKTYDSSVFVLNDINLIIKQGEWVVFSGIEKSGKSTLLKFICGMERPTSGEMIVNGQNLSRLKKENIFLYRRQLGIITQDRLLLNNENLRNNIDIVLRAHGFSAKVREARIYEVLSLSGLEKKINIPAGKLTEFEKVKLLIARATANNPCIILADDLDTGLNVSEREEIYQIFRRIKTQDMTIIFSSREQEGFSEGIRKIEIKNGQIQ